MQNDARLDEAHVDAYLARIGVERRENPSLAYLDKLIRAHQLSIPFENLDIFYQSAPVSLEPDDLFDKVISRKRGGFCYELNGLFAALLRSLGFEVVPVAVRITMYPNPTPPVSHRSNLVVLEGERYLVDVGFGGPVPSFALKVSDGYAEERFGQRYSTSEVSPDWFKLTYENSSQGPLEVLQVCTAPFRDYDFVPFAYNHSANPTSSFRRKLNINLLTEQGSRSISADTFTEHCGIETTSQHIEDDEHLKALLEEKFGLVL